LLEKDAGNETYYYHHNEHGDVTALTDTGGNEANRYEYDVFGNVVSEKEATQNHFRYAGEQLDQYTGQYYLRARCYNPTIGRFTQEDVYRGDGLNLYVYVRNNPVMWIDPSGFATNCRKHDNTTDVNYQTKKPLNEWLTNSTELLNEATKRYSDSPEWFGIDPEKTEVYYRTPDEVNDIRSLPGESGGHHPHGLALGGQPVKL